MKKILITGGAGFIGSEFTRQCVQKGLRSIVIDKLTYAGDRTRLKEVEGKCVFHRCDISQKVSLEKIFKKIRPQAVIHFAAETHVDRSIHQDVRPFIDTNVIGTQNLIDLSRKYKVQKFIHISTDEVYGDIVNGQFYEHSPLRPNNPYSATKAASDCLIKAAVRTHHFPAIIIRASNNYGPWQYPEKFIPVIILKAMQNEKIPVYGQGQNIREWLHVSDCARAILLVLKKGRIGETYNIGSNIERKNIQVVRTILKYMDKDPKLIHFVKDRPGHDLRYSLNTKKIRALGWQPKVGFETGIKQTLAWAEDHKDWLARKAVQLKKYWKKVYRNK